MAVSRKPFVALQIEFGCNEEVKTRKQLLVLSSFQRWFLFYFVGYTALFLAVFGTGIFLWFRVLIEQVVGIGGLLSENFRVLAHKHIILGIWVSLFFVGALLAVACLQALVFSRRIAGPIFAFSRHLEKCKKNGKLEPIHLRSDDLFRELESNFNELTEKAGK